ncbi:MAG: ABC transporter ATP-binding protein [Propionibacteriaceae bacterium]
MSAILSLASVSRTFGVGSNAIAAVRNVNMDVNSGELIAIMGASGSGKSTLLSIAGGLDDGCSGEVKVEAILLSSLGKEGLARLRRRNVGYVFQDYNLVPTLSVGENVALPLELDRVPAREAQRAAREALARVGIEELADRQLDQISGGQRQRVAIARAVVGERRLVLADEPTGALDSATGDEIMALLRSLADEGLAVVIVTHEARHASWADRVIFLKDGRIVDSTKTEQRLDRLVEQ